MSSSTLLYRSRRVGACCRPVAAAGLAVLLISCCGTRQISNIRAAEHNSDAPAATWKRLCEFADKTLCESSGLTISPRGDDIFYTHNDSGDTARFFAVDRTGKLAATFDVPGVDHVDWEDMSAFSMRGENLILLADVGDNSQRRDFLTLYVVAEPRLHKKEARLLQTIRFTFDDGPRDCEAVAVAPETGEILLVEKALELASNVYRLTWPEGPRPALQKAERIARIDVPLVTAMDISPDGRRLVVGTYTHAVEYVRRDAEGWAAALARRGSTIKLPARRQGEAICYGRDCRTLYLTSEKLPTPLLEVRRPAQ